MTDCTNPALLPSTLLTTRAAGHIITFMDMNIINNAAPDTLPFDLQAQVFKVLAHPGRLAILEILRDGEHCVCHMEAYLGFRQAYISQQLAVLREAGWITDRRDGWNIFYRVTTPQIYDLLDAAFRFAGQPPAKPALAHPDCSCPSCASKTGAI